MTSIFEGTQPPQFQGRNSNQKTGGPQVGDRGAARLASALEKNEDQKRQRFPAFRGGEGYGNLPGKTYP